MTALYDWNFDYESLSQEEWFRVWRAKELTYPFIDALNERTMALDMSRIQDRDKWLTSTFKVYYQYKYPVKGTSVTNFWKDMYDRVYNLGSHYIKSDFYPGSHNFISALAYDTHMDKFDANTTIPEGGPYKPGFYTFSDYGKIKAKYRRSITSTKAKAQSGKARLEARRFGKTITDPYWTTPWTDFNTGKSYPNRYDDDTPIEDAWFTGWLFEHDGSLWQPVAQSGQGELAEEMRRGIKRGDVFGPWILNGIRDMINQCLVTVNYQIGYRGLSVPAMSPIGINTNNGAPISDYPRAPGAYDYRFFAPLDKWKVGSGTFPCSFNVPSPVTFDDAWEAVIQNTYELDSRTCQILIDPAGFPIPRNRFRRGSWGSNFSFYPSPLLTASSERGGSGIITYSIDRFEFKWCTEFISPILLTTQFGYGDPITQNGQGLQSNVKKGGLSEIIDGDQPWAKCKLSAYIYVRSNLGPTIWKYLYDPGPFFAGGQYNHGWNLIGSENSFETQRLVYDVGGPFVKPNVPPDPPANNYFNITTTEVSCILAIMDFRGGQGFYYQGAAS